MNETFEKCPVCGGSIVRKRVEKLLRGGDNVAVVPVEADVCESCGERLYSEETVRHFEDVRQKLAANETTGFQE